MRATLLLMLTSLLLAAPAAAQQKKAAAPAAKAPAKGAPPAAAAKVEEPPLSPEAQKRIALIDPVAPKAVPKAALKKVADTIEEDLKAQGYEVIPPAQVAALHLKRKMKVPACNDAPDCLAKVGRVCGAGYVANLSISAAGKNFGVKLTLVDTTDGNIVSNIMGLVQKPQEQMLVDTVKKQVPRAATALGKRIAEKGALAVAPKPDEPKPVEPAPKPAEPAPKPAAKPAEPVVVKVEPKPDEPKPLIGVLPPTGTDDTPAPNPVMQPVEHISKSSSGGFGPVPGIVVGLVGAASLGIGYGYFGTQASSAASKVKAGTDPASNRSKAKDDALIADVCGGVGGALMATGIILAIVGATSGSSSTADAAPVTTSVAITPSGASIALSGSF